MEVDDLDLDGEFASNDLDYYCEMEDCADDAINEEEIIYFSQQETGEAKAKPVIKYKSKSTKREDKPFKLSWEQYAEYYFSQNMKEIDDDDIFVSPTGERCDFVPFPKIKENILKPDSFFPKGSQGINTLIPYYNPAAKNIFQYFSLETQKALFECPDILDKTIEELDEEIKELTEEIDKCPRSHDDYTVVLPFDENLKDSVCICADVMTFDFADLGQRAQFDVILMDPPWFVQGNIDKTTRGVELGYEQMKLKDIKKIDITKIQSNGYMFMWVVSSTYSEAIEILNDWGYEFVAQINWIKTSKRGNYKPSIGYYVQHTKETCVVAKKGLGYDGMNEEKFNDLIVQPRPLRQSQKPEALYEIIEEVFPDALYLEIFARAHNLRNGWVSLGLELPK